MLISTMHHADSHEPHAYHAHDPHVPPSAEENVYHLTKLLRDNSMVDSLEELHVVFIGSDHKEVGERWEGVGDQQMVYPSTSSPEG